MPEKWLLEKNRRFLANFPESFKKQFFAPIPNPIPQKISTKSLTIPQERDMMKRGTPIMRKGGIGPMLDGDPYPPTPAGPIAP